MKSIITITLITGLVLSASAAVSQRWTVETSRVQPAQFEAYHGETLRLEAALQSYGRPFAPTNNLVAIYWQTNGMDSAYWVGPAVISNNVLLAEWVPAMDVGANVYSCFIGCPGEIYRAAFQLRLRPSPGAVPSELPLPVQAIDFAQVQILHAPYYSKSETDAKIIELAPTPGNYATVSNRAMSAVQPAAISDMETRTHAAQTYQPMGQYLTSETDPTVSSAISTHNSSTSAHSDIRTALAGKQDTISDLATIRSGAAAGATAVQPASISDMETQTHAAQTYQPKGQYLTSETDPTVSSAISTHNSSTSAHSDIRTAISGKQDTISDLATIRTGATLGATAVQPSAISDMETQTHAAQTYQPKGSYLTSETDPTVSSAISTHNSSTSAHGDIRTAIAGKQATISDLATIRSGAAAGATAVQPAAISDMETRTHAADTYQPIGNYLTTESDPTVASAISAHNSSSSAHSDFREAVVAGLTALEEEDENLSSRINSMGAQMETSSHAEATYQPKGSYLTSESDPTVPAWAKATSKPSYGWSEIGSKPTFATVATSGAYSDLSGRPTIPTSLKCPTALTINVNGSLAASYDGSAAKTVNISTGDVAPEATATTEILEYHADGQAIAVSIAAGGTLAARRSGWPDGQSQMAFVTLAAGASVADTIKLIGYSDWPTGEEFMAVCTKRHTTIYVNPVCITEE